MNATVYLFGELGEGYSQYPTDYTQQVFQKCYQQSKETTQLAVHREGDLMYYVYIRKLDGTQPETQYIGICVVLNGIIFTDFTALFSIFENAFTNLVVNGEIVEFTDEGKVVSKITHVKEKLNEIEKISRFIQGEILQLNATTKKLPPVNYSIASNEIKSFFIKDEQKEIVDASYQYAYTFVYKDNGYNTRSFSSYKGILHRLNQEKGNLKQELDELNTKYQKVLNQKKQYRMVMFLILTVVACLVALYSFNSNIQSLTGDLSQRNEEIKVLNQSTTSANEKIETMTIDIAKKSSTIESLKKEIFQNKHSIDSLSSTIDTQEIVINNLRNDLFTVNNKLSYTSKQLTTTTSNLEDVKQKLSNCQNKIKSSAPLIIHDIQLANYTKNREKLISDYGQPIYSNKSRWIWFRINYNGIASGTKKLYYKIYDQYGNLKTFPTSPSGYSYSTEVNIYQNNNTTALFGWGADNSGSWSKGKYRIEIWHEDICLKSKSFTIL